MSTLIDKIHESPTVVLCAVVNEEKCVDWWVTKNWYEWIEVSEADLGAIFFIQKIIVNCFWDWV